MYAGISTGTFAITSLVDDPSSVRVEETRTDKKLHYSVAVNSQDLGKVIGKKGRTVKAMRVLLSALASMQNTQVTLEVLEPEVSIPGAPETLE